MFTTRARSINRYVRRKIVLHAVSKRMWTGARKKKKCHRHLAVPQSVMAQI